MSASRHRGIEEKKRKVGARISGCSPALVRSLGVLPLLFLLRNRGRHLDLGGRGLGVDRDERLLERVRRLGLHRRWRVRVVEIEGRGGIYLGARVTCAGLNDAWTLEHDGRTRLGVDPFGRRGAASEVRASGNGEGPANAKGLHPPGLGVARFGFLTVYFLESTNGGRRESPKGDGTSGQSSTTLSST